ncbi:MAG TPA: UvrD-helicase domain-containing protein [Ilumatobacter sp.]|nr:UvrD-helicase domain-containing protein [Ilumatobacter sp.]
MAAPELPFDGPLDQAARDRIVGDLDTNLFVEAGAGAGKTSSLVGRIVALVRSGVDIGSIAAITFTEKAAAELRHRVRDELVRAGESQASAGVDHAPIGTLHAFARRLLNDFPIAAGLPPGFTVLDELESHLAFEERWETLVDGLLDDPSPPGGAVEGGSALIELCQLDNFDLHRGGRRVATSFHENWDLVEARVDRSDPEPWVFDDRPFLLRVAELCDTPVPPHDGQAERLADLRTLVERGAAADTLGGRIAAVDRLEDRLRTTKRTGAKKNWTQLSFDPADLERLREAEAALAEQAVALLAQVRRRRIRVLGALFGRWVLAGALERADQGTIEFHDLLVLARRLVASNPTVRTYLHDRYQRILLDEFQDTDPIQLEIAVRLAAAPDDPAHGDDWTMLRPLPGRLFIVGDPKQSIYRFRRADIAQYLSAAAQVGADRELLTANFRSSRPVLDWVNGVFERLIIEEPGTQPAYQRLSPSRRHHLDHGSVTVFGLDPHDDLGSKKADEIRRREAADAASAVTTALVEGWQVVDDQTDELRPCRPGDITILLPARTSLPVLELALRDRGVPYRAENSSVVYVTTEIRHLMLTLRAAADPTDELALVAALRTPLYGCSDVELYEWKRAGGRWSIWWQPADDTPAELDGHPVGAALQHLGSIARRASRMGPADLLAALVDERRLLDVALDQPDARDVWRRVRYVVDQARAWSDAGGRGLRRYLAWVHLLASESRNADTILPEHDDDAVRIMTVHAAKGLEFPITVLSGMTTRPITTSSNSVVWHDGTWTISSSKSPDPIFEDFKPLDEQMSDAERRRLLYVACTRAVDHLVVSLHRYPGETEMRANSVSGSLLHLAGAADPANGARLLAPCVAPFLVAPVTAPDLAWRDHDEWEAERRRAFATARFRPSVSATFLAGEADTDPGLDKGAVDLDLPPWQRGRYGTAVGRAVHAVLQYADLRTGDDIATEAAAQCAAEGIIGMDDTVAALARSALAAPIVRRAVDLPHHRELFVAAPVGGRTVEGYLDLFVETSDGGVIVDYKTDQWPDDAERSDRIFRYRRQLAVYGVVVEQLLGRPAEAALLVRCRVDGPAEEIVIDRWPEALDEARRLIRELTDGFNVDAG